MRTLAWSAQERRFSLSDIPGFNLTERSGHKSSEKERENYRAPSVRVCVLCRSEDGTALHVLTALCPDAQCLMTVGSTIVYGRQNDCTTVCPIAQCWGSRKSGRATSCCGRCPACCCMFDFLPFSLFCVQESCSHRTLHVLICTVPECTVPDE